ncbi:MAG TPA: hypothetical protein VGM51_01935 [Armatimonadota bacterium]|jgi:hypothetical protein
MNSATKKASGADEPFERKRRISIGRLIVWPAAYLLLRMAAPFIRLPFPALANIVATVVFLLLPLLWLREISRNAPRIRVALPVFLILAVVWAELLLGMPFGVLRHIDWRHHLHAARFMLLFDRPMADLALITAAALMGTLVAKVISDPKMLLPVALVGALVDYWGVYLGTTSAFIKASPNLVRAVSAGIPTFGGGLTQRGVQPASFVGFGDWLFLTMFLAVAFRYDLQPRRTFWALLAFLVPAMLIVIFGGLDYLPAIVPMALAIVCVNGRRLKMSRSETFASLYALLMVLAMAGIYTLVVRRLR